MNINFYKGIFTSMLDAHGEDLIEKDSNDEGRDDAQGRVEQAIAAAVDAIDFKTFNRQTIKNAAKAFRAAADKLDKAAADL